MGMKDNGFHVDTHGAKIYVVNLFEQLFLKKDTMKSQTYTHEVLK